MKTMKKIWLSICSFVFMLALGFGVMLSVSATPSVSANAEVSAPSGVTKLNDGKPFSIDVWTTEDYMWNAHSKKTIYLQVENNALITGATWQTPYKP